MKWILALGLALLQQPVKPPVRPQDKTSITGYIQKMGTGEPLAKAVVTISVYGGGRSQSYTATTTAQGQYSFQNLDPGQYRLSASRSGFVRMEYGARVPNRSGLPLTLNPGQNLKDVVLQLTPAGTISGRIYDRDGEPLANVVVEALKYSYQEGQRVANVIQTARTDDRGEYRLFWLQPAQYFVSATPPQGQRGALLNSSAVAGPGIGGAVGDIGGNGGGGGRGGRGGQPPATPAPQVVSQDQAEEGYIPVYYPGTTDLPGASPINLPAGTIFSGVDLTVALVHTLKVTGQVINGLTGQPARNATVTLVPAQKAGGGRSGSNFRSRNINEQGGFEIRGVVPGSYEITGVLNDRNNRMSARLPIEIGNSDVQNVSIIFSPGFTLTGHVTIEGQQTGAGNQDLPRMRITVRSGDAQGAGQAPASAVQADGTFTLQQVGRDDYHLTVSGMPRNGYVKTARLGAADILNEGLRLDRQPSTPMEIVVSTSTGTADGTVQNDKQDPAPNVTVVFVPDAAHRGRLDLYRTTSTDATGHFHVEGIPPGDYRLFSWEDVETGAWQDPDFIRQFENRGTPVGITETGTSNIELKLIQPPA